MLDHLRIPEPSMPPLVEDSEGKEESEYMLRWSEHNTQLINIFHQLCQENEFTDVTLATEGDQFQAHKLVLSACSPYFRQLFLANPCKHPIVFLKDIPEEHMRLLLEYMYRGSIAVKHHQLADILRTASSLKIRGLTTALEPPPVDQPVPLPAAEAVAETVEHRPHSHHDEAPDTPRPLVVDENRFVPCTGDGSGGTGSGSSSLGGRSSAADIEEEEEHKYLNHHEAMLAAMAAAAAAAAGAGASTATDKFHHLETGSCHSAASGRSANGGLGRKVEGSGGRKSSAPKKLRLSSADKDSEQESHGSSWPAVAAAVLPSLSTTLQEGTDQLRAATPEDEEGHMSSGEEDETGVSAARVAVPPMAGSPLEDEEDEEEHHRAGPVGDGGAGGGSDDSESIIDTDQPVDFSATRSGSGGGASRKRSVAAAVGSIGGPRYSILGSYLKTTAVGAGRLASTDDMAEEEDDDEEEARCPPPPQLLRAAAAAAHHPGPPPHHHFQQQLQAAGLMRRPSAAADSWLNSLEQLSSMSSMLGAGHHLPPPLVGGGRPASRDSRGESREERNTSGEDNDNKGPSPPLPSLTDTLGIDIAGRLRSHFLANLPSQSYAWLNSMSGGLAGGPPPASLRPAPLGGRGGAGGEEGRHSSGDKLDKHPLGGIRTGEVGPNGKPSVACEVCGKKLADPSSLYRHRKIHSGDKPHKCPYCPRRFIQRYNMKQHIKTHRIELLADGKPGSGGGGELLASPHKELLHWQQQQDQEHHNLTH